MAPVKKPKRSLQRTFLAEWREHVGLKQEEAAEQLNVSRALLSKIENAKSPYSQRILEHLAEIYGCSSADLLERRPLDRKDGLWPLLERAQKTTGTAREQMEQLIKIGLEKAGV